MNTVHFSPRRTLGALSLATGAALLLSAAPASAQQSEIDALRQQLAAMQARLDKLEAAQAESKATAAVAPKPVTSNSKTPVVIGGLLQLDPTMYFDQDRTTGRSADTFRVRRGEIRLAAPTITPRVSGSVMFDLAKTNNTTNAGSVLQEMIATYNFHQSAQAPQFFDIGQFKPGFGYESDQLSSGALPFTERALFYAFRDIAASPISTVDPDGAGPLPAIPLILPNARPGGGLGDARDQGARLRGSFRNGRFAYNIGLFNGIGERQNSTAGGDPKAYVGRLIYRPGKTGLELGVSGLRANTRGDIAGTALDRRGYGTFLVYRKKKFSFQSEYAHFDSSQRVNSSFYRNDTGYYAGFGYLIKPKLELVARYDTLKIGARSGAAATNNRTTEYTLGTNYYLKGNFAKIQADLVKVEDNLSGTSTSDGLQLRTNFQVGF